MTYLNVRNLIKTGDLVAFSRGGWTNWGAILRSLVRVGTLSDYNHVGVACVMSGRVFVLEAVATGIRLYPLSRAKPFYWCSRPQAIGEISLEWAFEKLGDKYSKWQAIKGQLGSLNIGKDNHWQCAEYVLETYRVDGDFIDIKATPSALVKYAMENWGPLLYIK